MNTAMKNLQLPEDIQEEVISFIKKTQHSQDQQEELNKFNQLIPNSFQHRINHSIFTKIFLKRSEEDEENYNKVFLKQQIAMREKAKEEAEAQEKAAERKRRRREMGEWGSDSEEYGSEDEEDDELENFITYSRRSQLSSFRGDSMSDLAKTGNLEQLVSRFQTKLCKPEDMLITRGAESFYIYFLISGTIEIYLNEPHLGRIEGEYFELHPGNIFGELGVLLQTNRSAYARAQDYSILEIMSAKNFKLACQSNNGLAKVLKNKMQNYQDKKTILVKQILRHLIYQTHFYDHCKDQDGNRLPVEEGFELPKKEEEIITDLCYQGQEEFISKDEVLYNPGDEISAVMIVLEGEINVVIQNSNTDESLMANLTKRSSYGFYSVLKILKNEDEPWFRESPYKLVAAQDSLVLWLPFEKIIAARKRSRTLNQVI